MKPITVVYRPQAGEDRFCPRTGKAIEPSVSHYLETADGRHLGVISSPYHADSPDPVAVAHLFEAAPELLEALKELVARCDGEEGVAADGSNIQTIRAHAAIAKVEVIKAIL